jgi:hypothetical protein
MSTTATIRLYDMLKPKLGEQEARMFIQHFEESFDDQFASKSQQLSTKQDVAELRADIEVKMAQMETRIIKWMFIFLIGQAAAIIGVLKLLH